MRHQTTREAKVIEVIQTCSIRGEGRDMSDPVREVWQYWSKEGILLAENDLAFSLTRENERLPITETS